MELMKVVRKDGKARRLSRVSRIERFHGTLGRVSPFEGDAVVGLIDVGKEVVTVYSPRGSLKPRAVFDRKNICWIRDFRK